MYDTISSFFLFLFLNFFFFEKDYILGLPQFKKKKKKFWSQICFIYKFATAFATQCFIGTGLCGGMNIQELVSKWWRCLLWDFKKKCICILFCLCQIGESINWLAGCCLLQGLRPWVFSFLFSLLQYVFFFNFF